MTGTGRLCLRALLLFVVLPCVAAEATADSLVDGVRHVEEPGAQHPDAHVHGFVLRSVFVHQPHEDGTSTIHRRMMQFDENPHLHPDLDPERNPNSRRLNGETRTKHYFTTEDGWNMDWEKDSRKRTILLAKLNLLAYDRKKLVEYEDGLSKKRQIDSYIANGGSRLDIFAEGGAKTGAPLYGVKISDVETELIASQKLYDTIHGELEEHMKHTSQYLSTSYENKYWPASQVNSKGRLDLKAAGIAALEFKRSSTIAGKSVHVLVFRGTLTTGDRNNIFNWLHHFITNSGFTKRLKDVWVNEAGLTWTKEMENSRKGTKGITFFASAATCIYNDMFRQFARGRANGHDGEITKANNDYSISKSDFHAKGYWSITKALVEKTYDNFKAQARTTTNATTFILSGHSAGGTRAALASMYMKKMKSVTIPTVTFAATGSQCPPRDLHSGKNLLDEVDPYISHSQITEYVHVLDPWGQALGYDNGRVCRYGKTGLAESQTKKQCEKVFGYHGVKLWFNEGIDMLKWRDHSIQEQALDNDFANCRYRTHFMDTMLIDIMNANFVKEDGTTDFGCSLAPIVAKDDLNNLCGLRDSPCVKHEIAFAFFIGCFVICICGCCATCCCMLCCRKKLPPPAPPKPPAYTGGYVPFYEEPPEPPKRTEEPLIPLVLPLQPSEPPVRLEMIPAGVLVPAAASYPAPMSSVAVTPPPVVPMHRVYSPPYGAGVA